MGLDEAIVRVRAEQERLARGAKQFQAWRSERDERAAALIEDFAARCVEGGIRPVAIEPPAGAGARWDAPPEAHGWPIDEVKGAGGRATVVTDDGRILEAQRDMLRYQLVGPYDLWSLSPLPDEAIGRFDVPEFAEGVELAIESTILALEDAMAEFLLKHLPGV